MLIQGRGVFDADRYFTRKENSDKRFRAFLFLSSLESLISIEKTKHYLLTIKKQTKMNKATRFIKGAANVCALIGGLIEIFLFSKDYIVPAMKKKKSPVAEEAKSGEN